MLQLVQRQRFHAARVMWPRMFLPDRCGGGGATCQAFERQRYPAACRVPAPTTASGRHCRTLTLVGLGDLARVHQVWHLSCKPRRQLWCMHAHTHARTQARTRTHTYAYTYTHARTHARTHGNRTGENEARGETGERQHAGPTRARARVDAGVLLSYACNAPLMPVRGRCRTAARCVPTTA